MQENAPLKGQYKNVKWVLIISSICRYRLEELEYFPRQILFAIQFRLG